jgi:hypothetical protein
VESASEASSAELQPCVLPGWEQQTLVPQDASVKLVAGSWHQRQTDLLRLHGRAQPSAFFMRGGLPRADEELVANASV